MTGAELKAIREHLDMDTREFAAELGYQGSERNNGTRVDKYERGLEIVPPYIARLAWLIREHFDSMEQCLPDWPSWDAYLDGVPTKHKRARAK